jgi:hypothetical protein
MWTNHQRMPRFTPHENNLLYSMRTTHQSYTEWEQHINQSSAVKRDLLMTLKIIFRPILTFEWFLFNSKWAIS